MHETQTPSLPPGVRAIQTLGPNSGYVCEVRSSSDGLCGATASQRLESTDPGCAYSYRCPDHESIDPPTCYRCDSASYETRIVEYVEDEGRTRTNGPVCQRCLTRSCAYCPGCRQWILRDTRLWTNGRYSRCERCAQSSSEEPTGVGDICRPYGSAAVSPTKGKHLPADVLIGTEFEAKVPTAKIAALASSLPSTVGIKRDGSLTCTPKWQGIEIITPPRSGKAAEAMLTSVAKVLRDNGCKVDSECGFHIHIDGRAFIPKRGGKVTKISRLWNLYSAASDTIQRFLPSSRRSSRYCKRLHQLGLTTDGQERLAAFQWKIYGDPAYDESTTTSYKRSVVRSNLSTHYNGVRYYEMNLHSLFTRGTIEFRAHSGTLNERKAIEWASLHVRLVSLAFKGGKKYTDALAFPKGETAARKHLYKVLSLPRSSRSYFNERARKFADGSGNSYETNYEAPITKNGVCAA